MATATVLRTGLNPYGLTYVLGLLARGTPRANPSGRGLEGFIALCTELGAETIEIWEPWLAEMSPAELAALRQRLGRLGMVPVVSSGVLGGGIGSAIRSAVALGATTIRIALTRVLQGDRALQGDAWPKLVDGIGRMLKEEGPCAADAGVTLAIENHQDFTSAELVAFCEGAGRGVGICFDTGNAWPVAEAPLDFARTIARHVRHLHLKDYNVQMTDEGYRLVRSAIGDGAVPFHELVEVFGAYHETLTAVLEPGALEARHIRLFTPGWWRFYPPKPAPALAACLASVRPNRLAEDADWRTPWERGDDGAVAAYELAMIRRSAANMKALGLMKGR
jgi:sugar phosphate isomerase/epimerase